MEFDKISILENAKNKCINKTCSLNRTFTPEGKKLEGKLIAIHEAVYAEFSNGKKEYILHFDIDGIHGNMKNSLAKDFCTKYTLEQMQDEYIEALKRKAENAHLENIKRDADTEFFNAHLSEISNLFILGKVDIKQFVKYATLKYEYRSERDGEYNYKGLMFNIEIIRLSENNFKVNASYYNHIDEDSKIFETDFSELMEYLRKVSEKINAAIGAMLSERKAIDNKKAYDREFQFKCLEFVTDKKHIYIFKTARGSFCVNYGIRWSNKGEGKFYRISDEQLYKMLTEKGITTYAKIEASTDARMRDVVDTLEFIPIVALA